MNVNATSGVGASAAQSGTQAPNPQGQLGKDAFLQLFVAELKYQDPMQPTDSQSFMQQMALFSMLEQLQAMHDDLDAIKAHLADGGATSGQGANGASAPAGGEGTSGQ